MDSRPDQGSDEASRAINPSSSARRLPASSRRGRERETVMVAAPKGEPTRDVTSPREKDDRSLRQDMMTQEFEHRLVNSLQLIVSLLSLQSRQTESVEAAAQLTIAAKRVGAFGRVHRRLHLLDHLDTVELKQYVQQLCDDLSEMLFDGHAEKTVVVDGAEIVVPTRLGIPLGFIVNELITNAAKHGTGVITVTLETVRELGHCLSVSNKGPSLPDGFQLSGNRGLGLKIIGSLVRQINGRIEFGSDPGQEGACFKVFFPATVSSAVARAPRSRAMRASLVSLFP
jgi:two-component system, sensor histidine kinase PdtaS